MSPAVIHFRDAEIVIPGASYGEDEYAIRVDADAVLVDDAHCEVAILRVDGQRPSLTREQRDVIRGAVINRVEDMESNSQSTEAA